jgi:hypothetical protein
LRRKLLAIYVVVFVLTVLTAALYLYFNEKTKAAIPEDIEIEAVLKPNKNEKMKHHDFVLEVTVHKKKDSQHLIYPYLEGLEGMSFDNKEEDGYYVPGSIGTSNGDEVLVEQAFREKQLLYEAHKSSFIGFYSPAEAGVYKMRLYFREVENFTAMDNMYLTYVHRGEKGFGLDKSWTKIIKIKSELE